MVEIARAFTVTDTPARLVILDEPTSSLDARRGRPAPRLRAPVRGRRRRVHPDLAPPRRDPGGVRPDRGDARRPGRGVDGAAGEFTRDSLVAAMGSVAEARPGAVGDSGAGARPPRPAAHPGQDGAAAGRSGAGRPCGRGRGPRRARRPGPDRDAAGAVRRGAAPEGSGAEIDGSRRAGRRRPADRRHLPALVDRREHQHRLAAAR